MEWRCFNTSCISFGESSFAKSDDLRFWVIIMSVSVDIATHLLFYYIFDCTVENIRIDLNDKTGYNTIKTLRR